MIGAAHTHLKKHHEILESLVIFYGWILRIAGYISLLSVLMFFLAGNLLFAGTALGASVVLITVGTITTREYDWSGIALLGMLVPLIPATMFIPHGIDLIWFIILHLAASIAALVAFGGWSQVETKHKLYSLVLVVIFANFVFAHIQPELYGLHPERGAEFMQEQFEELATAEPAELLEVDEMREQTISLYELSLFSTDEQILSAVEQNPEPLNELQAAMPYVYTQIEESFFGYAASMYLSLISEP